MAVGSRHCCRLQIADIIINGSSKANGDGGRAWVLVSNVPFVVSANGINRSQLGLEERGMAWVVFVRLLSSSFALFSICERGYTLCTVPTVNLALCFVLYILIWGGSYSMPQIIYGEKIMQKRSIRLNDVF